MTENVSSTTDMIAGALIGVTFMAAMVACCCALLLNRRQNAGAKEAQVAETPGTQTKPLKTPDFRKETSGKVKSEKVRKAEAGQENKKHGRSSISFLSIKKNVTKNKTSQPGAGTITKPSETLDAVQSEPAKPVKVKQPKTPKLKAVKETKKAVAKASQKLDPRSEKGRWSGLFRRKEAARAKEAASNVISPTPSPLPPNSDTNNTVVTPATAQAAVGQVTTGPIVQPPLRPEAAPHTQPPEGIAATAPQDTTQPVSAPTEPEKPKEANADSVFNLFTDSAGEESEISKFAANFDNISLDSLLGEGQGLLDRLHKK